LLGHIEDYCEKLYAITDDDGTRLWGPELRVDKQCSSNGGCRRSAEINGAKLPSASVTECKNGNALTTHAIVISPKPEALANLFRNPNLLRPKVVPNVTIARIDDEVLQEENNETPITIKSKRSRVSNPTDQQVIKSNQEHSISPINIDPKNNNATISSNSTNGTSTPMDVSQNKAFLSAEPGSHACRAK